MSLDVDLYTPEADGREEWVHYTANITHNLGRMAEEAEIYGVVWRPEENGITTAGQLIAPLSAAIVRMRLDPERFKKLDSPNGWGTYENFLPWIVKYYDACVANPQAHVRADR
jgi:hypothetical protein